jgi:transposase
MPSKPKTQRRETTPEERAIVWAHYLDGLTYSEIKAKTGHPKPTIQSIIKRLKARSGSDKFKSLPRPGASRKVDSKGEKALLRHTDKNTKDLLTVLGTPSKSGKQLHQGTVRKILKRNRKARQQARKKPYLSKLHKKLWY